MDIKSQDYSNIAKCNAGYKTAVMPVENFAQSIKKGYDNF